jgi:hypothetical protein
VNIHVFEKISFEVIAFTFVFVVVEQCYQILEFLSYIEFCHIKGFQMYKELLSELISSAAAHEPNVLLSKIFNMIPIKHNGIFNQ